MADRELVEPGLLIRLISVYEFMWGAEFMVEPTKIDAEHLGGVGDGMVPVLSGHLFLCEVITTHSQ